MWPATTVAQTPAGTVIPPLSLAQAEDGAVAVPDLSWAADDKALTSSRPAIGKAILASCAIRAGLPMRSFICFLSWQASNFARTIRAGRAAGFLRIAAI